ncbi:hypothetical protein DSUL_20416 [Desulfovibrionales bacterium]
MASPDRTRLYKNCLNFHATRTTFFPPTSHRLTRCHLQVDHCLVRQYHVPDIILIIDRAVAFISNQDEIRFMPKLT